MPWPTRSLRRNTITLALIASLLSPFSRDWLRVHPEKIGRRSSSPRLPGHDKGYRLGMPAVGGGNSLLSSRHILSFAAANASYPVIYDPSASFAVTPRFRSDRGRISPNVINTCSRSCSQRAVGKTPARQGLGFRRSPQAHWRHKRASGDELSPELFYGDRNIVQPARTT